MSADGTASTLEIRPATQADAAAIWRVLAPIIRAGETYAFAPDMAEADALAYWLGPDKQSFVAVAEGRVVGTYYLRANQSGGGGHICNCGYMVDAAATGRGIARAMGLHSLDRARRAGFRGMQFNFVVASNHRAIGLWQTLGFRTVGRLPAAFRHPRLGFVDALVMFRSLTET